jgi:hypothetical protein
VRDRAIGGAEPKTEREKRQSVWRGGTASAPAVGNHWLAERPDSGPRPRGATAGRNRSLDKGDKGDALTLPGGCRLNVAGNSHRYARTLG